MPRAQMEQRVSNRTALSVRSRKMGELHAYDEQQCPSCNAWQPRFHGSGMYGTVASSTFTQCRPCRNGVA
jgi:hypothetical protein